MDADQELKSLKRGLNALILIAQHRTISIAEVSRTLGLPRTTAERILVTLESERFIQRDQRSKRFTLAARVLSLAGGFSAEDRLIDAASPLLFEMTSQIAWPLAIAVAAGDKMSVRLTTDPVTSLGLHKRHIGSEIAMAGSSSGLVHLAFISDAEREEKIALLASAGDPAQSLAMNRPVLETYLQAIRRDGYGVGPDMGRERAISVPLREQGRVRAVLLMMYIARAVSPRMVAERFAPELKALAGRIEAAAFGAP